MAQAPFLQSKGRFNKPWRMPWPGQPDDFTSITGVGTAAVAVTTVFLKVS